jgi:hypothetical protein
VPAIAAAAPLGEVPTPAWEAETEGVQTNLRGGEIDENEVVVYSTRWIRRIRHGDSEWPSISNAFVAKPLHPERPDLRMDDVTMAREGDRTVSIFDVEDSIYKNSLKLVLVSLFASPLRVNLCESRDRMANRIDEATGHDKLLPDWRTTMCQVEAKTNRITGSALPQ